MSTILITGGTGLVGRQLTELLIEKGHNIIVVTRDSSRHQERPQLEFAEWDVKKQAIDAAAIQRADHIIHLAGAPVFDKRWTPAYKRELEESRIKSSELLVRSLQTQQHTVKTVVSASAIGWYGADDTPGYPFIETDKADDSFLGRLCQSWEESIQPAQTANTRLVIIRIGIVLSNRGGFLAPIQQGLRFGVATITGDGKQVVSWIHIQDLCRIFLQAIEDDSMTGPYNAVAPAPASMKEIVLKEGRLVKGSFFIPMHVPAFLLKPVLGERSIEVLKSTTVSCNKIKDTGFTFLYPSINAALQALKKDTAL
ncbi:MAG: TIGR01777 family protein [Chitinophagaceae bacterium]|nr:MAG: TIGR01777 family protein [Chitinophagaceae bacterium]